MKINTSILKSSNKYVNGKKVWDMKFKVIFYYCNTPFFFLISPLARHCKKYNNGFLFLFFFSKSRRQRALITTISIRLSNLLFNSFSLKVICVSHYKMSWTHYFNLLTPTPALLILYATLLECFLNPVVLLGIGVKIISKVK